MKVMTMAAEVNLSDLLNRPKDTLARLVGNRRLLLHRRDAEDLVLTTAERAAADTSVVHLPDDEKQEFAAEWLDTLRAAAEMDNNGAVEGVVAAWRSTAEVYADPELYAALIREHDGTDYGPVPPPEVPA
jgi:hypothetical protein